MGVKSDRQPSDWLGSSGLAFTQRTYVPNPSLNLKVTGSIPVRPIEASGPREAPLFSL